MEVLVGVATLVVSAERSTSGICLARTLSFNGKSSINYLGRFSILDDPVGPVTLEILFCQHGNLEEFRKMFGLLDYLWNVIIDDSGVKQHEYSDVSSSLSILGALSRIEGLKWCNDNVVGFQ